MQYRITLGGLRDGQPVSPQEVFLGSLPEMQQLYPLTDPRGLKNSATVEFGCSVEYSFYQRATEEGEWLPCDDPRRPEDYHADVVLTTNRPLEQPIGEQWDGEQGRIGDFLEDPPGDSVPPSSALDDFQQRSSPASEGPSLSCPRYGN